MAKKPTDKKSPLENLAAIVSEPDKPTVLGDADIDSIVLLIVEPHYAFAYWDITQQSIEEVEKLVGPQYKLTLRFYEATTGIPSEESPFWDIEVFDRIGNWYIKLDEPGQLLVVDIGLKDDAGRYCTISRTHSMKLDADQTSLDSLEEIIEIPLIDMVSQSASEPLSADHDTLKKILGPHFYHLLIKGNFESIVGSTAEAVFQDLSSTSLS